MASQYRRRCSSIPALSAILALLAWLLPGSTSAASAVLGIDIGTEYIKAALVKPGIPLEVVLTRDSRRKELSAVAFKPSGDFPERLYGRDALALAPRSPGDVYPNLKPLLGLAHERVAIAEAYRKRHPALELVFSEDGEFVGFRTQTLSPENAPFSVPELLAMQLQDVKANAETMAGHGHAIRDAVFTIPPFFTVDEKRAIESAADLAGFKITCLVSDGLAVGVNYAVTRNFPNIDQGEDPEYHMVYDMGAGSTTATIIKFQARTVKDVGRFNKTIQELTVVGTGWDRSLGGDTLNTLIVDDMIDKFVLTNRAKESQIRSESVKSHARTMAKLWKEAERARQVLSANTVTTANFEALYEHIDFPYELSRHDFEALAESYAQRIGEPIAMALTAAKLDLSDLRSIILHGGVVRTPLVQKTLEELVADSEKLKNNVNADESAVFGAAFKAAGLSPSFRVKEIRSNDAAGYAAVVSWTAAGKRQTQKVFLPTSQVGSIKQMAFKNLDDFSLSISQHVTNEHSSALTETPVSSVDITNLTASVMELQRTYGCDRANISTMLLLRLDPANGLPEITGGTVACEIPDLDKKPGMVDSMKGLFGLSSKKSPPPLGKDIEEQPLINSVSHSTKPLSTDESILSLAHTMSHEQAVMQTRKRTQTLPLSFKISESGHAVPSVEEVTRMKGRLAAFARSDQHRRLHEELFNLLESTTYRTRDLLYDTGVLDVTTTQQRDKLENFLATTSEWMFKEGHNAIYEAIEEKLRELSEIVEPIKRRKNEMMERPKAIRSLEEVLEQSERLIHLVERHVEEVSSPILTSTESLHPLPDETKTFENTVDGFEDEWLSSTKSSTVMTQKSPSLFYTEHDLKQLSNAHDTVNEWLRRQVAVQEQLHPSDDPILTSSDIVAQEKYLKRVVDEVSPRILHTSHKSREASSPTKSSIARSKKTSTVSSEVEKSETVTQPSSVGMTSASQTYSSTRDWYTREEL